MLTTDFGHRQRTRRALHLHHAFRRGYDDAKRWYAFRLLGDIALAMAAPMVIYLAPQFAHLLGATAGGWILIGRMIGIHRSRLALRTAVAVQEIFETDILQLPRNPALGRPPAEEEIARLARRQRRPVNPEWFDESARLPAPAGTLVAQRSCVVWARRLHREFGSLLRIAVAVWLAGTVAIALYRHANFETYLLALLLPMLPALLDAAELATAHRHHGDECERLEERIDELLDGFLRGDTVTPAECRAIQDEIYRFRASTPLVPNWYYRRRRQQFNRDTETAAEAIRTRFTPAPSP